MKKVHNLIILLLLAGSGFLTLDAQITTQVVSKNIDKNFSYAPGMEVVLEGERAEIQVETWDKNEVEVHLQLMSRHPDAAIAKRDLQIFQYKMETSGNKILIRNFIASSDKPASNLKATYLLKVPEECPVKMTNYFGKSEVSDLQNKLEVNGEFSPISLANIKGDIHVRTKFGDLEADGLDGRVKIESQRSNLTLKRLKGTYDIQSKYGIVKIFSDRNLVNLNIEAERSDVYFFNPNPTEFGYDLMAHYGGITVPNDLKINFVEKSDNLQHAILQSRTQQPGIFVKITYGDIVIRNAGP
ncbi:MAG: DUF4097 family beta strand repeat protein [Saprospiraceae bacterium]|nr:DUF4097 family beta strand repeat protein [Saprospiraceae bacterium]